MKKDISPNTNSSACLSIYELTHNELESWLETAHEPSFRAKQIQEWLWKKFVSHFSDMKNIGKALQEKLAKSFQMSPLTLVHTEDSETKETTKYLWKLKDGALVESVLIRAPDRQTVCVSSQVGCPARCSFCASGQKGLIRNLSAGEIVSQVVMIHKDLLLSSKRGVTHVVYMGMGEPLENYDAVIRSIRLLSTLDLFGLSQRRITLSTVGVIEGLHRLMDECWLRINVALSLHAPNQEIRKKIIPYARKYELSDVLSAVQGYQKMSGRDVTYEYILIDGLNSAVEHATELGHLLLTHQCSVNLIPYNPNPNLPFKKPSREVVEAFQKELSRFHIHSTCRYTKGDDIAAACGQLALQEQK